MSCEIETPNFRILDILFDYKLPVVKLNLISHYFLCYPCFHQCWNAEEKFHFEVFEKENEESKHLSSFTSMSLAEYYITRYIKMDWIDLKSEQKEVLLNSVENYVSNSSNLHSLDNIIECGCERRDASL